MYGPSDRGPSTASEWIISLVLLAGVVGVFLFAIFENFEPVKLFPLFFVAFWLVLLPIHEAGHALAAALLGWYVARVVIGFGARLARFRVGTATVELRAFPIEGFVIPLPRDLSAPRLKSALIYFAGPGTELLLLGLVVWVVGPATLLTRSDAIPVIAAQAFCMVAILSVFTNLLPHSTQAGSGWAVSDGMGILRSFGQPDSYFAKLAEILPAEIEEDDSDSGR